MNDQNNHSLREPLYATRDGLSVFFRGFTLMSSRAFIVNGVTFVAVEQLNKMCKAKQ